MIDNHPSARKNLFKQGGRQPNLPKQQKQTTLFEYEAKTTNSVGGAAAASSFSSTGHMMGFQQ